MTIPRLACYPMPEAHDFPSNKVDWTFDSQRSALLIHDLQDYFLDFYSSSSPLIEQLVSNVADIRRLCKKKNIPVFYTAQPVDQQPKDRGLLNDMWGKGIDNKPHLQAITEKLKPEADEIVLTKWRYSAFQRSALQDLLAEQKRDQLLIVGIYGHIGCLMTAADAFMRDIKPFMIGDAIADFSLEDHLMALRYVAGRCGKIISTNDLRGQL